MSNTQKYMFIHIPKTGGVSIRNIINKANGFVMESGHISFSSFQKKYNTDDFFKFSFVRNPWDRSVSAFSYLKKGGRNHQYDLDAQRILRGITFHEFITNLDSFKFLHTKPQMEFIQDIDNFDFIGRFESIQGDFNTVCNINNIPQTNLPHKNISKHKHYTEYYDDETRDIIAEKYAEDIEMFGYKFGED
jgi:chondroitin 4-sulfotransferase 11